MIFRVSVSGFLLEELFWKSVSRLEDSISSIDTRYIMVDGRKSQCSRA